MEYSGQILSDKVIEFGGVITLIITVLQSLTYAFKVKSDHHLMMKLLNKDSAADQLTRLFNSSNAEQRVRPLKWCLVFASLSIAFIVIHYSQPLGLPQSDNSYAALIFSLLSISFLIYHIILRSLRKY